MHGFASSPREMEELGEALRAAGLAVSIPLLPGHGTDGSDFLRTGVDRYIAQWVGVAWLTAGALERIARLALLVVSGAAAYFGSLWLTGFRPGDFNRRGSE